MAKQIRPTQLEKKPVICHFAMKWLTPARVENLLIRKANRPAHRGIPRPPLYIYMPYFQAPKESLYQYSTSTLVQRLALQDIVVLLVVCARINRPFILPYPLHCPHCCNTIARLMGNIRPPLQPPFCMPYTIHIGNNNIVWRPTMDMPYFQIPKDTLYQFTTSTLTQRALPALHPDNTGGGDRSERRGANTGGWGCT